MLFRSLRKGIPKALEEAALIDGCGRIKTFFRIVMPLAKSGLFSVFIFVFLACWNDVYTSVLYINANSKKTLTVAIYSMIGKYDINWVHISSALIYQPSCPRILRRRKFILFLHCPCNILHKDFFHETEEKDGRQHGNQCSRGDIAPVDVIFS